MPGGRKLKVYNDGRCPFCQWAEAQVLRFDVGDRLEFRDYREPGVADETPFTVRQLDHKMHVRTPDGQWHAGYFGWVAVFSVLPKGRLLAGLLRVPPLRWLGPLIYQFVANRRYRVPQFMLTWLGVPAPCPPGGYALPERERTRT